MRRLVPFGLLVLLSACGSVSPAQTDSDGAAGAGSSSGAAGAAGTTGAGGTGGGAAGATGVAGAAGAGGELAGAAGVGGASAMGAGGGYTTLAVDPNRTNYGNLGQLVDMPCGNAQCTPAICIWEPSPYFTAGQPCPSGRTECPPNNAATQLIGQLTAAQASQSLGPQAQRDACAAGAGNATPPNCVAACP